MKRILIGTIALIYFLTFLILRASTHLVNILGEAGNNVMMRLMELILTMITVECFVSEMKPMLVDIIREGCLEMIRQQGDSVIENPFILTIYGNVN